MQHAVTLVPQSGIAYLYLSKSLLQQKSPQAALENYNQAIKLNDKLKDTGYWIDIQDGLCELLVKEREFDKALAIYENVLKELEGNTFGLLSADYYRPRVRAEMAEIYHKAGNLDKAIEIYEEVLKKQEEKQRFWFFGARDSAMYRKLVKIYREKGDEQKAQLNEDKAKKLDRESKRLQGMVYSFLGVFIIGIVQFLLVIVACVCMWIRIVKLKKEKNALRVPPKKVSWGVKDVLTIYARAFFSPVMFFLLVMVIVVLCDFNLTGWVFSSMLILPLLIGLFSIIIYWTNAEKRFEMKFSNTYPGIMREAMERPISVVVLTLWQLLCVGVINIGFSITVFGAIMGLLTIQSL